LLPREYPETLRLLHIPLGHKICEVLKKFIAMSICLNMIVKDEARVIERCLASVRPFIDHWVIVDTGSSDDTPQRIAVALAGIPGELHHRPWRNFGHNRSEALDLARGKADYLLFIDADETLGAVPTAQWPALNQGAYSLEARYAELSYDRVNLVSSRLPWQWKGVLHEYLDAGQVVPQPRVPGFWIQVTPDGARSGDPKKFEKDAQVLETALLAEPDNTRYVFYLAQSYRDAGMLEAALTNYLRRAAMGGWEEEVWYSLYQCAKLSQQLNKPYETIISRYLAAYEARPQRAETLTALATYLRDRKEWHKASLFAQAAASVPLPADRLFVDLHTYQWRAADEYALAMFYTQRQAEAVKVWRKLLADPLLPAQERPRIEANIGFAKA
jgi:glycosyltransferase involved in cell wall biosynthesis